MTATYKVNQPIETLFKQITAGIFFAQLYDAPFTPKQTVDMAVLAVAKTGVFIENLKDLNRKPTAQQTWTNFKAFFAKANRDYKSNLRLTTGQLFSRSNAAPTSDDQSLPALNQTAEVLANLATATAADRATVTTLTDTIAKISPELASAQAKLVSSLIENKKLL